MPAITRTADHRYIYEGVTYPGVTSILKVIDKSGPLIGWASRMTAEAALQLYPVIPAILEASGRDGAVRALTARSGWKRDQAAATGTEIHGLADRFVRGEELPEMTDETRQRVWTYAEWYTRAGWRVRASEGMVVNPEVGYGGTVDLIAYDADGRTVLADLKTGKDIYREAILQLAAYGAAEVIEYGDVLYPMPIIQRYVILHLTDTLREVDVTEYINAARRAFLSALSLHSWTENVKGVHL